MNLNVPKNGFKRSEDDILTDIERSEDDILTDIESESGSGNDFDIESVEMDKVTPQEQE
jgi:hypothetical protein